MKLNKKIFSSIILLGTSSVSIISCAQQTPKSTSKHVEKDHEATSDNINNKINNDSETNTKQDDQQKENQVQNPKHTEEGNPTENTGKTQETETNSNGSTEHTGESKEPSSENSTTSPDNQTKNKDFNFNEYFKLSENDKFDYQMKYLNNLENSFNIRQTNITQESKNKFNEIAHKLNFLDYDTLNKLGANLPSYDQNGNYNGMLIQQNDPGAVQGIADSYNKDPYKSIGLARTLTNETYLNIAKQTFQITFNIYPITNDSKEKEELIKIMNFDDDLSLMINFVEDQVTKNQLKDELERNKVTWTKTDKSNFLFKKIWGILLKQNNDNFLNPIKTLNQYKKYFDQNFIKFNEEINKLNISEGTKNRVKDYVVNNNNFYALNYNILNSDQYNSGSGTAFIIDYLEPSDKNKYPTKFYFMTNYHVVNGFDLKNIKNISLARLNNEYNQLNKTLKVVGNDINIPKIYFNPTSYNKVVDGRDFLNTSPSQYSTNKDDKNQEYLDFAIFEIDFEKLFNDQEQMYANSFLNANSAEELAQKVTNNYALLPEDKKIGFLSYDYLNEYSKMNKDETNSNKLDSDKDQLYALSYPSTKTRHLNDFYLELNEEEKLKNSDQLEDANSKFSLWTNQTYEYYNKPNLMSEISKDILDQGGELSSTISMRSFKDKAGVFDKFIHAPSSTGKLFHSKDDGLDYYEAGLGYALKNYSPAGGSSGSSIRTKDNKLVSIITTGYARSMLSASLAIRSNGYNLEQLYGDYNMPQYDIIYGTGKDQKTSYREAIKSYLEKNSVQNKTHLFKNGFETENIDQAFVFKK
ncbi:Ig-specific serine endopeptidase MIP [Mycoplasma sp. OR1901]|uniref:Ig-specific serine endopeptidase MIP n=1 Tax=Mycoplasma sp. OR1901 TaxID=2742195 RepID=UPI001581ECB1|nr:hypothetical protein [Mycoplasma sp. OR1901]QKT05473.1 hypothetical protein HTZ87_02015 [Mycoplasma sp. OR1901]